MASSVNQQFAEKLHALTLPRDVENTRARDLVDLVWFAHHFTFRADTLAIACIATFERRATHPWPPVIDVSPESWTRPNAVWRAELDLAEPTPAAAASAVRTGRSRPRGGCGAGRHRPRGPRSTCGR
ncbi:MAG: nucleotidyl transferase AbiEii/AbiGii toxin family protein [Chloroflexota bacterium]